MKPRDVEVFRKLKTRILQESSAIDDEDILGCLVIASQLEEWKKAEGNYWAVIDHKANVGFEVYQSFRPMTIEQLIQIINAHGEGMTVEEFSSLRRNTDMLSDSLSCLWQEPNPYFRHIQISEWLKIHQYEIKT